MEKLSLLISQEEIRDKVTKLATEISRDYRGKQPLLIGVLKGSFIFLADLIRVLDMPVGVEFIRLSSYGSAKESSGTIKVVQGLRLPIRGRDVLVIEDIVDTGLSLSFFLNYLRKRKPSSIKVCALFDKPSRHKVEVPIDYLGFTVPDKFLVGYGLDFNEDFRYLADLYVLEE